MKIITPKFEIIEQQYNDNNLLTDMFKHIEICGRTCYKSEDKITEDSYKRFVSMLTNSNHGAMLEHGTIYLKVINKGIYLCNYEKDHIEDKYINNPYSKVVFGKYPKYNSYEEKLKATQEVYITTNYRVLVENGWLDDLKYICKPTENHEKRYTVRFTYHLGVARDVNRHRVQSVGEESTRYCNYSKEKFGKELNVIEPIWFTNDEKKILHNERDHMSFKEMCELIARGTDFPVMKQVDYWMFANLACEYAYMMNTTQFGENNWTAQKGSLMLPLDTKTESIHTAFVSDWCHFFNLRALGTTGSPRPSAKEVAWPLMIEFMSRGYISTSNINSKKYTQIIEKFDDIEDYIKL